MSLGDSSSSLAPSMKRDINLSGKSQGGLGPQTQQIKTEDSQLPLNVR